MSALQEFDKAQAVLVPEDDTVVSHVAGDYQARAVFTSGIVRLISDSVDDLGTHYFSSGSSGALEENSSEHRHLASGRATHLELEKSDGSTETLTVFSSKSEHPLEDVVTGEALSLCLWNEINGKSKTKPRVMALFRHVNGEDRRLIPPERPVLLASGELFSTLFRYAFKRPLMIAILLLIGYGATFFFEMSPNPAERYWHELLHLIAPVYSFSMGVLVGFGLCDPSICTPGRVPGHLGGFLFLYSLMTIAGFALGLMKSAAIKSRNRERNGAFNQTVREARNELEKRQPAYLDALSRYRESIAAQSHSANRVSAVQAVTNQQVVDPDRVTQTNRTDSDMASSAVDCGYEAPEGENRYQFRVSARPLVFRDIINRIDGFETVILHERVKTKSVVTYHLHNRREYTHTEKMSFDCPKTSRKLHGLAPGGELDSVLLPKGFGAGPVEEGDALTVYTLDLKERGEQHPYGAVALVNKTQGWYIEPGKLRPVADALITDDSRLLTYLGAILSLIALVAIAIGFIGGSSLGAMLVLGGFGLLTGVISIAIWRKRKLEARRASFAQLMDRRLADIFDT